MSIFGKVWRVSTFGESHCMGVGCIVDGVPPRLRLTEADIQGQLCRRRPGQSDISTKRNESDRVMIISGVENGITLGTPIALLVHNLDHRPADYNPLKEFPRPSHADFTYQEKYGVRASSGGGRSSARETIGRVAAGSIAEKWLSERFQTKIVAFVSSVGTISISAEALLWTREEVDRTTVRCPDLEVAEQMIDLIKQVQAADDSVGGIITCVILNAPAGWGEPVFDRLEATLAHAMLSIPATKGFEIGSGFDGARQRGSEHNDAFILKDSKLQTATNRSGGVLGGISNGNPIVFRVAFKPPATIARPQTTSKWSGDVGVLEAAGRHDPCVVQRAVPIVECMAALVLADAALIQLGRQAASDIYDVIGSGE